MVDLEEKLSRRFRILFSNSKDNSIIFSLKGLVYKVTLFFASNVNVLAFLCLAHIVE